MKIPFRTVTLAMSAFCAVGPVLAATPAYQNKSAEQVAELWNGYAKGWIDDVVVNECSQQATTQRTIYICTAPAGFLTIDIVNGHTASLFLSFNPDELTEPAGIFRAAAMPIVAGRDRKFGNALSVSSDLLKRVRLQGEPQACIDDAGARVCVSASPSGDGFDITSQPIP